MLAALWLSVQSRSPRQVSITHSLRLKSLPRPHATPSAFPLVTKEELSPQVQAQPLHRGSVLFPVLSVFLSPESARWCGCDASGLRHSCRHCLSCLLPWGPLTTGPGPAPPVLTTQASPPLEDLLPTPAPSAPCSLLCPQLRAVSSLYSPSSPVLLHRFQPAFLETAVGKWPESSE